MNQVTIHMTKVNSVRVDNNLPVTPKNIDSLVAFLQSLNFGMIRFEFSSYCYYSATEALRQREYNKYIRRINKIAGKLGMELATVENQIQGDFVFPHKHIAVLVW